MITQIKNEEYRKIQIRAVSNIMNFSKVLFPLEVINDEEESKVLLHYTDDVLFMVAVVIGDNFFNYYNVFMPGLKQLLMSLPGTTPKQITIRTLTIEFIGFLVSSIKNYIQFC